MIIMIFFVRRVYQRVLFTLCLRVNFVFLSIRTIYGVTRCTRNPNYIERRRQNRAIYPRRLSDGYASEYHNADLAFYNEIHVSKNNVNRATRVRI